MLSFTKTHFQELKPQFATFLTGILVSYKSVMSLEVFFVSIGAWKDEIFI